MIAQKWTVSRGHSEDIIGSERRKFFTRLSSRDGRSLDFIGHSVVAINHVSVNFIALLPANLSICGIACNQGLLYFTCRFLDHNHG